MDVPIEPLLSDAPTEQLNLLEPPIKTDGMAEEPGAIDALVDAAAEAAAAAAATAEQPEMEGFTESNSEATPIIFLGFVSFTHSRGSRVSK